MSKWPFGKLIEILDCFELGENIGLENLGVFLLLFLFSEKQLRKIDMIMGDNEWADPGSSVFNVVNTEI